jgi:hypothetical protein
MDTEQHSTIRDTGQHDILTGDIPLYFYILFYYFFSLNQQNFLGQCSNIKLKKVFGSLANFNLAACGHICPTPLLLGIQQQYFFSNFI